MEYLEIYGDLGAVTAGIKLVGNNTSEILAMVMNTGHKLNDGIHILTQSSNDLSQSVQNQNKTSKNTTKALDDITHTIQENAYNAQTMATLANNVSDSAVDGKKLASDTSLAMDNIAVQVDSINEAITVIDQIAFQTNILSLNAAVEAATAGEAGKGFAVVAQEVRNLANRSAEAAKDIKDIVEDAIQKAHSGKAIATDMINGYNTLSDDIVSTIDLIKTVSKLSKQQEQAILKINMNVTQMERSTSNNAKVLKNISSMSNGIEDISDSLITAASKASFLKETVKQVCDINLLYDIADLKVALFDYKDDVYSRLANASDTKVEKFMKLDNWLEQYSKNNPQINSEIASNIRQMNETLYKNLTNLMDASVNHSSNTAINDFAKEVEIESAKIFTALDSIKVFRCKEQSKDKQTT